MQHNYRRINYIQLEHELSVEEYYSADSGLRIILSKIKSPKIYGYFTVLTEAENDEGLPHTLEHLIFLGSHKYPYKGLLDFLAYKCLSEGTNAWTSVDHTCYTIETFGIEGFSNILPIYLDFILSPTLEEDMFLSEVHHIYENGTHNGVVYSEMKSVENNCENIVERTVITNLYTNEKSGYRYETGGTLEGLRKTNNKRVKEYFKKFYRLNNFAIIIFGNFDNDCILNIIYNYEQYHLELYPNQKRKKKENYQDNMQQDYKECVDMFVQDMQSVSRPWNDEANIEKRNNSKIIKKYYPCNNLNNGQVTIAWRGCKWNDFKTKLSISLLGNYLTDLTTSPLSKRLLEDKENTYCSSLDFSLEDLKANYFTVDIYDVSYKFKARGQAEKTGQLEKLNDNPIDSLADHPTDKTANPTDKIANTTDKTANPTDKIANPTDKTSNPTDKIANPTDKTTNPTDKTTNPTDKTTNPTDKIANPTDKIANPTDQTANPIDCNPLAEKPQTVKMNLVGDITRSCLEEVYDHPMNMDRLRNIIIRSYLQHLRDLETSPQYLLNEFLIKYFIYGRNIEDLENCLNLKKIYIGLLNENECYWKEILKKFFIDNHYVEVRCYPSYKKAKKIELFEKKLVESEQKKYGMEKLNNMVKHIRKIKESMEKKPPKSLLNIVKSASPKNVFIDGITVFRNFKSVERELEEEISKEGSTNELCDTKNYMDGANGAHASEEGLPHVNGINVSDDVAGLLQSIENDLKRVIFPIQLSYIQSNFVSINVLINSNNIDEELKKYIPLLSYLLFETDVQVNNRSVKCELFMEELIRNTINYDCNYGLGGNAKNFKSGNLGNILCIQIVGLLQNYEKLFDLLFLSVFKMNITLERLELILKSAYQNLLQKKIKPKTLVVNLEYALRYMKNSNSGIVSIGQQELILQLIENKKNLDELYNKLNTLKTQLFHLKNFALVIDGNFSKIKNIFAWYDKWFSIHKEGSYTVNDPIVDLCFGEAETKRLGEIKGLDEPKAEDKTYETDETNEADKSDCRNSCNYLEIATNYDENNPPCASLHEETSNVSSVNHVSTSTGEGSKDDKDCNIRSNEDRKINNDGGQCNDGNTGKNEGILVGGVSKPKGECKYVCLGPSVHRSLKKYLDAEFEKEDKNFMHNIIKNDAYNGIVCGIKSTDVSYLKLTVKAPSGYGNKDYCALLILREFFSMTEGPLYSSIRGGGFAYECALEFNCILGELSLRIYRSSDIICALKEALKIFEYYCTNEMKEDELSIAKCSAYYTIFNNQETVLDRASQTIFLSLKNLSLNFYENLLAQIENITTKNLLEICQKYLSRIVNFKMDEHNALIGSTLCIICCSEKTDEIQNSLKTDIKFGQICNLNVGQLFHFFKHYDLVSCLKVSSYKTNGEDPGESSDANRDTHDDDRGNEDGESEDGEDVTEDSSSSCKSSIYLDDDSYPGYSDY
ncbi:insulinase, putative [Plasmodium malariae]|uniref:Insulinase, putative n=1 Tax=Plasmodium malariae TaxID=5858 RepID=A0A1A8VXV3_PLAMA|nr:insulinase, putative [Plasmodium malariae]